MYVDFHRRRFNTDFFQLTHVTESANRFAIRDVFKFFPGQLDNFVESIQRHRYIETVHVTRLQQRLDGLFADIPYFLKNKKSLVFHGSDERCVTTIRQTKPKLETHIVNVYKI